MDDEDFERTGEVPDVEITMYESCLKERGGTQLLRVCKKVYDEV